LAILAFLLSYQWITPVPVRVAVGMTHRAFDLSISNRIAKNGGDSLLLTHGSHADDHGQGARTLGKRALTRGLVCVCAHGRNLLLLPPVRRLVSARATRLGRQPSVHHQPQTTTLDHSITPVAVTLVVQRQNRPGQSRTWPRKPPRSRNQEATLGGFLGWSIAAMKPRDHRQRRIRKPGFAFMDIFSQSDPKVWPVCCKARLF
jgi:hypothetical protein